MTGRGLLDTHVVVRYLVGDNPQHGKAADKIFSACDRGEIILVFAPSVLSECVFVLESFYKRPRNKIAAVLQALIASPGVEIHDRSIHLDALRRYAAGKAHFVDCTLAAMAAAGGDSVISFDRDFKQFSDVKVFNPLEG